MGRDVAFSFRHVVVIERTNERNFDPNRGEQRGLDSMHGVRRAAARRHFIQLALERDGDRLARLIFQFDVF